MTESPQFNLVLGGGGLKGLTHIGALRALEERNLVPQAVIGCSMGSLVAAAWAVEMPLQDMFWGDYFGSLVDKFGVQWMVNCSEKK